MFNIQQYFAPNWFNSSDTQKQKIREFNYCMRLLEKACNMFEYDGLPEEIDPTILERILSIAGICGIDKVNDKYVPYWGTFSGTIQKNGLPVELVKNYLDGKTGRSNIEETAYCFNVCTTFPDRIEIERYAEMLANIDVSMVCNIIYSRNLPVPIVSDDGEKRQVEEVIKNAIDGNVKVVSSDRLKALTGQNNDIPMLDIFNVQATQNMQDLSRCHEDILKRFMVEYGIDINVRDKKAQTNNAEVEAYDDYSKVTMYDKLEQRKKFCERINKIYGLNVSVKFKEFLTDNMSNETEKGAENGGTNENVENDGVETEPNPSETN